MTEEAEMFFRSALAAALDEYPNDKAHTIFEIAMHWTQDNIDVEDIWDYEEEFGEIFDAWVESDCMLISSRRIAKKETA